MIADDIYVEHGEFYQHTKVEDPPAAWVPQLVSDRFGTPPVVQISDRHSAGGRESGNVRASLSGTQLREVGL